MSIVPLKKVSFFGVVTDKEHALRELQSLGCMHMIPQTQSQEEFAESIDICASRIRKGTRCCISPGCST